MSDLISRQAAIKALIEEGRTVDSRYLESERIIHESDAVEVISRLPSAQPEMQWIPVTERLPDKDGDYLVCYEDGYREDYAFDEIGIAPFEVNSDAFGTWQLFSSGECDWEDIPVTAWMPLPEPYQCKEAMSNEKP